jgi:predicted AAA+ superfamily ATPase
MEELIYSQNPWWEWENWETRDRDLRKYNESRVKWRPSWIDKVSLEPSSMNIVMGPRQVGKTTGVKLLISELLKGRSSGSIFYFSCDLASDSKELRDVLNFYRRFKERNGVKSSIIFLDEVTGLEGWWRILKGYVDLGLLERDALVLLGSASFRFEGFSEAFPGRRGMGRTVEVLPLSFPEYARVRGVELRISEYSRILSAFDEYLETGGFPRSINGDERFPEDLIASIEMDSVKAGRNPRILRLIAKSIIEKAPSAISFNSIAGDLGISHNTVHDYVRLMEDMFLLGVAYLKEDGKILYRREKKIFIRDPFLAVSLSKLLGADLSRAALLEWVVQEHVLREFGEVYFWRNGLEVDVISGKLKVEVKAGKPHRRYPRDVTVLSEEDIPAFLLNLGR